MQIFVQILIISLICIARTWCECDVCQNTNFVACHTENVYSLCINRSATRDYITCPENHVCTSEPHVCYPKPKAKPLCKGQTNLCGLCSKKRVYACTNETTIAFCYGANKPFKGAEVSYCTGDTVCDIYSKKGFCSESFLVKPSCITTENKNFATTTEINTMATEVATLDTTTITPLTTIEITTEPAPRTLTVQPTTSISSTSTKTITTAEPTKTTPMKRILSTAAATTHTTTTEITNSTTKAPTSTASTGTTSKITTTASPTDPDQICKLHADSGPFPGNDPKCTTFVVCYMRGGAMAGLKKKCPSNQYFSPTFKTCSSKKPDVCV